MTVPPEAPNALLALGDADFVSLTTFRRSGEAVSTPVWIARDGDALIVTTPSTSGKVKRLRNNSRVEIRPSSRRGAVEEGIEAVTGTAEIRSDAVSRNRLTTVFRSKYKLEYRIFLLIERIVSGQQDRTMLRITPATA